MNRLPADRRRTQWCLVKHLLKNCLVCYHLVTWNSFWSYFFSSLWVAGGWCKIAFSRFVWPIFSSQLIPYDDAERISRHQNDNLHGLSLKCRLFKHHWANVMEPVYSHVHRMGSRSRPFPKLAIKKELYEPVIYEIGHLKSTFDLFLVQAWEAEMLFFWCLQCYFFWQSLVLELLT